MKRERHAINKIKDRLKINNAIISKADKWNSIVISYQNDYHKKIMDFIANNNLATVNNDPTKTFQRKLRNLISECQISIRKDDKWKYVNLNPSAPSFEA
jgi:hypothetical protein